MEEKKIITNERRFYPLIVSSEGLDPQSHQESVEVWEKFRHIPTNNKNILLSTCIIENLYNAEKTFSWEPYYSARLAYLIRELFFQNISQTEFYKAVEAQFGSKYRNRYNEILLYINNKILTSEPDPEEAEELEVENADISEVGIKTYTLLDALSKYSYLANQNITSENIKLKSQVALVRPTLSNWLKNYRDELGIGLHGSVDRAKFLFESTNTKRLPGFERERIHALVRSLEDNELLNIDTKKQQIVFRDNKEEVVAKREKRGKRDDTETEGEASPDIFERFQNMPQGSPVKAREDLQSVGTKTFAGGKIQTETKNSEEGALLSRIKNIFVPPQKANEPAPKEDTPKNIEANTLLPPEPLGTLRFSAKHILPAERKESVSTPQKQLQKQFQPDSKIEQLHVDPRLAHFRPQEVPIPEGYQAQKMLPKKASEPASQPRGSILERTSNPGPVSAPSPIPPLPPRMVKTEPASAFRIKPNRD